MKGRKKEGLRGSRKEKKKEGRKEGRKVGSISRQMVVLTRFSFWGPLHLLSLTCLHETPAGGGKGGARDLPDKYLPTTPPHS